MKKEYSPLPGWDTEIAADTDAVADGIERCNDALVDQCWETQGEGVAVSTAYQEVPTGTVSLSSIHEDSKLILHSTGPRVRHGDVNIVSSCIDQCCSLSK